MTKGRVAIPVLTAPNGTKIPERTFAMANITSVSLHTEPPATGCLLLVAGLFGLTALTTPIHVFSGELPVPAALGGLAVSGGIAWWAFGTARSLKPTYWIGFHTSGEEVRVLYTQDKELADGFVAAIHRAMELR